MAFHLATATRREMAGPLGMVTRAPVTATGLVTVTRPEMATRVRAVLREKPVRVVRSELDYVASKVVGATVHQPIQKQPHVATIGSASMYSPAPATWSRTAGATGKRSTVRAIARPFPMRTAGRARTAFSGD